MKDSETMTSEVSEGRSRCPGSEGVAEHTPGPWRHEPRWTPGLWWDIRAAHRSVASVPMSLTVEEQEANARLIAAAPDMLAALTELLDVLAIVDRGWGDGNLTVLQQAVDEAAIGRARAAIAKATLSEPGHQ